jgi:hypothetical protein
VEVACDVEVLSIGPITYWGLDRRGSATATLSNSTTRRNVTRRPLRFSYVRRGLEQRRRTSTHRVSVEAAVNLASTELSYVKVMRPLISFCATVIAAYWFDAVQYSGTYAKAVDTLVRTIAAAAVSAIQ